MSCFFFFVYGRLLIIFFFFFSSRRRHTRLQGDWSSDVCSSDLRCGSRRARENRRFSYARRTPGHAGVSAASPLTFGRNPSHRDQKAKRTWPSSASDKLCGEWKTSVSCSDKDATSTTSACPGNATG